MKTASLAAAVLAFVLHVFAQTPEELSYNNKYDDANLPVSELACSTPLENKGYTTLGSLPDFPFAGGAYTVEPWNTPTCDTCYALIFGNTTIYVLAVDTAPNGFVISEEAMDVLTDGLAVELGRVNVGAIQVDATNCGF